MLDWSPDGLVAKRVAKRCLMALGHPQIPAVIVAMSPCILYRSEDDECLLPLLYILGNFDDTMRSPSKIQSLWLVVRSTAPAVPFQTKTHPASILLMISLKDRISIHFNSSDDVQIRRTSHWTTRNDRILYSEIPGTNAVTWLIS